MGLRIRTNIASINAQRRLAGSTKTLQNSMAKLASGKRINRAADDSAGLSISENLRADVRSLSQAKRNASDGVSMVQTAEGGLVETSNMLIRLRELAIQAASDTVGTTERGFIEKEYSALKDEIDRISSSTEFNGTRLLVGDGTSDHYPTDEQAAIPEDRYPLEIQVGKDYLETADARDGNPNPVNIIKIRFDTINTYTSGEGSLEIGKAGEGTMVSGKTEAQKSISILDTAITKVNDYRAYLGSIQNRLDSTISNLGVQIENISESKSRIQDTDYAAETAEYTKSNILQNAGTSVLSSANQQPQVALGLIQNI